MIKIQQQQDCEYPTKHWRVIQEYQLLVLIQSFLFFLFKSFPGYKYKIWKFLSSFYSMNSDRGHLRWAKQSFWQCKSCIIPLENLEFWAENMHLPYTCTHQNMNNNRKKTNSSTNKLKDLKKL